MASWEIPNQNEGCHGKTSSIQASEIPQALPLNDDCEAINGMRWNQREDGNKQYLIFDGKTMGKPWENGDLYGQVHHKKRICYDLINCR